MRLIVRAPFESDRQAQVSPPPGVPLGHLLGEHQSHITGCQVNGEFVDKWQDYLPAPDAQVTLFTAPQEIISGTALLTALVTAVVSTAISLGLSYLIRALTPTKSQTEGKPEQVYGIAGLANTTAQGTPKLLCYGKRRVYGHILSTRIFVTGGAEDDGEKMLFSALYYMGEGPIESMGEIQIDDIAASQFPGLSTFTRLGGADNATLIHSDFSVFSQVWSDNRQLALHEPIVYQTRSSGTTRAYVIFFTPFLRTDTGGQAQHTIRAEISAVSPVVYVYNQTLNWSTTSISPRFGAMQIDFPSAGQWLIRLTLDSTSNAQNTTPTLFNVMEEQPGSQLYPDSALLAITGIANNQVQSFEALRASALVFGRRLKVWNGISFTTEYTNGRAWVLRDILTNARVGLGHRIPESLIDDDSFKDAQDYWNTEAYASSGIPRNQCDLLINDRKPAQDWIKMILSEGFAALPPSGGLLKLIVDQPGSAGLLYSSPGNMLENTLVRTLGSGQGLLPNTIQLQFPDEADGFRPHMITYRMPGTESEPQREASPLTLYSHIRFQHAWWYARRVLLRQRLVQRTLQWQSPLTAMVSEPFDKVSVAYDTSDYGRGVSGFLGSESTTTRLVLDRIVTLAAATTYTLIVRHQATNSGETRTVATTAGQWGAIAPTVALSTPPAPGDLWALGVVDTQIKTYVLEDIDQGNDGTYTLTASEYVATLYEFPGPSGGLPAPPITPPTPPPPPPPPGISPPSAVALSGVFGGSGTISLSWTAATVSEGDTLDVYHIYRALDVPENFTFFAAEGSTEHTSLTAELYTGFFIVFALGTLGGAGPGSNIVQTDWQFDFSSNE